MARIALTVQDIERAGTAPSYAAAAADGNSLEFTGREFLHIKNGAVADVTVTIDVAQTVDGLTVADRTFTVGDGEEVMIKLSRRYTQLGSNTIHIDYSDETSVTIAALRL